MATHTFCDFTLRTSFPKKGMHTLQKGNKGVSISQRQAKTVRDYYMYEGNEACKRLIGSGYFDTIEKLAGRKGIGALYYIFKDLFTQNLSAETIINYLKSMTDTIYPAFFIGDIAIVAANYYNIYTIFNDAN